MCCVLILYLVGIVFTRILYRETNKYFELKKLVGRRAPLNSNYLLLLLFAPILHETLTISNFDTNTICQLSHGSSFKYRKLKSISQQKCFADCFTD